MRSFCALAFSLTGIAVFAAQSLALHAQASTASSQGPSISVSLGLAKDNVPMGESPQAVVTMRNIGKDATCFRTADSLYRIHVEGKNGGPPETELQRKRQAEVQPGNG